jgi:hypothetical protein
MFAFKLLLSRSSVPELIDKHRVICERHRDDEKCLLTPQTIFESGAPTLKLRRKLKLTLSEGSSPGLLLLLLTPGNLSLQVQ